MKISETFECSGQNLSNSPCQFWNDTSIPLQNFASFFIVMTHNYSVNFKLIYFLLWIKGSYRSSNFETFKCSGENLPCSSCHFPNHKSIFLQIFHQSSMTWKIISLYVFRSNVLYCTKRTNQSKNFENFECSDQNSPSSCHFWNNKSVFLQIFHHTLVPWDITSLYFF